MRSFFHDDDGWKRATWLSFSELIDKAVILCELKLEEQRRLVAEKENSECELKLEEQRRLVAEKENSECRLLKILSEEEEEEEEEESRRRIFSHFPRKLRSSLKEPNLIDFNHSPTDSESSQYYLQWLPSPSRMEALQYPRSDESFSLPSLVEYNSADELENPDLQSSLSSCLTINTSRKRRAVNQIKRASVVKKPKVESPQVVVREKPAWLVQLMSNMEGATEATLIFEKSLFVTDVNRTQNRLSMPYKGLLHKNFLTDVELGIIEQDIGEKKKAGVEAILVNQRFEECEVKLKRWEMMKKDKVNGTWNYTLVGGWNEFVKANELKAGDNISVWSFRCYGVRYFALEKTS